MAARVCLAALAIVLAATTVSAQQSSSYRLDEWALNTGGRPIQGQEATSASFRVTLDSLGDTLVPGRQSSAGFHIDGGGFTERFRPPGEVLGLRFTGPDTLAWDGERSSGTYNLYRASIVSLGTLNYGGCEQQALATPGATDASTPVSGSGFFYLVTAVNRLEEEGTKGSDSEDLERQGTVCP